MGYTRYWERTEKKIGEDLVAYVRGVIADCKDRGITIRNGAGLKKPNVSLERISINGDGEDGKDLAHETFYMDNKEVGFNFCKTARKPYDYAVRKILRYAEKNGYVKKVSCDGSNQRIISDAQYLARG